LYLCPTDSEVKSTAATGDNSSVEIVDAIWQHVVCGWRCWCCSDH